MNDGTTTTNCVNGFVNNLTATAAAAHSVAEAADQTNEKSSDETMPNRVDDLTQEMIDTFAQSIGCSDSTSHKLAVLHSLSNIRFIQNQYGSARSLQNKLLELMKVECGTVHANVGHILNNLATICLATGDHKDARDYLTQSVQIFGLLGYSEKIEMAETLNLLANSFLNEENFTVAEPLLQSAFSIAQRLICDPQAGLERSEIVPFLQSYALLFRATDRVEAAHSLELSVQALQQESDQGSIDAESDWSVWAKHLA